MSDAPPTEPDAPAGAGSSSASGSSSAPGAADASHTSGCRGGRSRRHAWIAAAALVLVLLAAFAAAAAHTSAGEHYDEAVAAHRAAVFDASASLAELRDGEPPAESSAAIAEGLLTAPDRFVDVAAKSVLAQATASLRSELATAAEIDPDLPEPGAGTDRPTWYADLDEVADLLVAEAERLGELSEEAGRSTAALESAEEATRSSGLAFLSTVPASATAVEGVNVSARHPDRIAFRAASAAVSEIAGRWEEPAPERVAAYVAAATSLEASHAAEDAEKAGPLYDRRVAVEAFARSIAGGVLLEFDWAPTANGFGQGGTYGGTAEWDLADGGRATITFSDSVAALWDDFGVRSLIAHEIGHAITAKCHATVMTPEIVADNEQWATAWAIGMGYTGDGSGESLYGRPSDALIELSKGCR